MDSIKINKVQIRNLQIEDYDQLAQSFTRVYSDGSDVFWTHKQIEKLIRIFPEGQIVTVVDEKIVGCALSIIVNYDDVKNDHTYAQVTGKETFNTHNPKGNILYGIEVFIHPQYRGLRLARRMYEYRKDRQGAPEGNLRPGAHLPVVERLPRAQGDAKLSAQRRGIEALCLPPAVGQHLLPATHAGIHQSEDHRPRGLSAMADACL